MAHDTSSFHKDYFFDMPIDLFCVMHPESRKIIQANTAFEYILGWKTEEIIGQVLDTFVLSDNDKNNIEKAFSKLKLQVHSISFETELRTKNNLIRYIDWKCYVDDEQRVYAIGRDITSHKDAERELTQQLILDQVTGVAGRKSFLTLLQDELSNAARFHYTIGVILVDIDHFKNFNERFGELKGDECLRQVATALKTCLRRKTDFLARLENDLFAVLLSRNNLEKTIKSAEYLRSSLEKLAVRGDADETHQPITISLGVTAIPENREKEVTINQILTSAQRALNISQQRGGNQVSHIEEF